MISPPNGPHQCNVLFVGLCACMVLGMLAPAHAAHEPVQSKPENLDLGMLAPRLSVPEYRSPLNGFQSYNEDDFPGWKQANDRVGEIGGWRVYAREAFETEDESADEEQDAQ